MLQTIKFVRLKTVTYLLKFLASPVQACWRNTLQSIRGFHKLAVADLLTVTAAILNHYFYLGAYLNRQTTIRFNLITGKEKTYQTRNGIPKAKLFGDKTDSDECYRNNK